MKHDRFLLIISLLLISNGNRAQIMNTTNFKTERVTKTATIKVSGSVENVFPLFGAFEERKWASGWNPTLIFPATETIEEGTTFKTPTHGHEEGEFLWRVSKYEPASHLIQYLVSTENRYWTITVMCTQLSDSQTAAAVTYTFFGLNELGNKLNKHSIERMFKSNLSDWEEEMNYYLANGKVKSPE